MAAEVVLRLTTGHFFLSRQGAIERSEELPEKKPSLYVCTKYVHKSCLHTAHHFSRGRQNCSSSYLVFGFVH